MIVENSGKIYQFKLDFNLGFAFCEYDDYTDKSKFSGNLISVFNLTGKESFDNNNLREVLKSPILFGPSPIFRSPNSRGRGSWKIIGQVIKKPVDIVFKTMRDYHVKRDWTKLQGWSRYTNFEIVGPDCDYEDVRFLELNIVYGMREIEIRTTMHLLLLDKKNVQDFYDLKDLHLRNLYIQTVNTSFSLHEANKLLTAVDELI